MTRRRTILATIATLLLSGAVDLPVAAPAFAQDASAVATAPADAQGEKIVTAAEAFIASLTDAQKTALMFSFNDAEQRARWSNFLVGIVQRAGVPWGDLSEAQRTLLMDLLGTVLSPDGVTMVTEQMAADDVLAAEPASSGGPGGGGGAPPDGTGTPPAGGATPSAGGGGGPGGGLLFGSDLYYVAFLGEPSATAPWMLQFGGHHLGINATVVGPNLTLSPTLTGGQPVKFTLNGEPIYIVEKEVAEATALLNSLTDAQRAEAVRGTQSIDLVLGPGKDGMVLQPESLPGSEMTDTQKTQFLALIASRLGIMNADDLAAKISEVQQDLDQTYFAWFGSTTDTGAAYWRVTGPRLLLEFSPQGLGGDSSNHLHNMYRDPTNEYGSAWASLE